MEDSVRIFLVTRAPFFPMRKNVRLASDLFGGPYGSWMWAQAAHFVDDADKPIVGGTLRIATTDILTNPWNPVAGTNWVYDMMPIRGTADQDTQPDTRTGLRWPGRLQKGELFIKQGQPMEVKNTDWCKLTFVPENVVPLDAWADWDATTQTFLTVRDRFGPSGTTAVRKSVAYFPKDIFSVPLHDGSTLSMGDFIMRAILQFDRAKPASAIYDSNYVASYNAWVGTFKGVKFITDNPDYGLIVEFYSDFCPLNGEVGFIPTQATFWPEYAQGPGMWHTVALGVMCEASKELAFSEKKAGTLGVPWMTFIAGASKAKLKSKLDSVVGTGEIPYAPTLGQYVSTEQAKERYSNLLNWYNARGHFWVASGPFYLHSVQVTADVIQLERFENYPDPMDRWLFLLEPVK
jgi:peptide/nickel transport system substrate-binding protein